MARVKGPNGIAIEMPDDIAQALLLNKGEYELVEDAPSTRKRRSKKAAPARPAPEPVEVEPVEVEPVADSE